MNCLPADGRQRTGESWRCLASPSIHICIALNHKLLYLYGVRIEFRGSATEHGITPGEIRAVLTFPALRLTLAPRRPNSTPVLHIGSAAPNEPWIEVIADMAIPEVAEVFHAMMLRRSTFAAASLFAPDLKPTFARQRR